MFSTGLREATKEIGQWEQQKLFTDPQAGYERLNQFLLSTSQVCTQKPFTDPQAGYERLN